MPPLPPSRRAALPTLVLALGATLAGCAPTTPPEGPPDRAAAPISSATGGFAPLGERAITIEGQGTWTCSPTTRTSASGCRPDGAVGGPTRPGALPISGAGGPPGLPPEGTPIQLPSFSPDSEIAMQPAG